LRRNVVQVKKHSHATKSSFRNEGYRIHQEEKKIHPVNATPRSPRILLSGASGMLGTAVRQMLAGRGADLLQLVRRAPAAPGQMRWDPSTSPSNADTEQLEGLEAAIHLGGASVAAHRWTAAYKREIRASRVESTHALAAALARLRQPPNTLLVASATGIYGNRGDELLDERSSPGTGFLADLCREWEAAAQPAADAGIRVVHLRFGVVLGPGAGALAKILPLFWLGLGGRLGSGHQWMSWISLVDAVAAALFVLDTATLDGPVNLTAPAPVTNAEFTRALGRAVHRPAILPAPAFALRLALGQMADEALLSSARVFPNRLAGAGFQFAHSSVEAALAAALEPAQ
jgi:uncharacterized protein (TIGR01777 family)